LITFNYHGQELLSIKHDIVFKAILGKPENKDILADFIESILDIKVPDPRKIILTNTELSPVFKGNKLSRFDIRVQLDDNTSIEIEIQLKDEYDIIERSIYYESKLLADQISEGNRYKDLNKSISMILLNFSFLRQKSYLNS
jgi:predicted transposase/invertase (TIGR01784 family)